MSTASTTFVSSLTRRVGVVVAALATAAFVVSAPSADAQPAPSPNITWEKCPTSVGIPSAECGRIDVPMRYDQPNGRKISVGFVRMKAQNPGARRGAVFGNPGGPGGDAYSYFGKGLQWPQEIRNEWDMVAVQPRGLQGSTPLECSATPPTGSSDQLRFTLETEFNHGAFKRRSCQTGEPGYPESITTENNARDWDEVRKALGYPSISIIGTSYGTYLGSVYATLFPAQTDKLVLDSAMDPNQQWTQIMNSQRTGYEMALNDFFDYVARNNATYKMGDTPLKAYQYWSAKVVAEAGTNPTVAPPPARVGDLPPGLEFAGQAGADFMTSTGKARVETESLVSRMFNPSASQLNSMLLMSTQELVPVPAAWDQLARSINGTAPQGEAPSPEALKEVQLAAASRINLLFVQLCNENVAAPDRGLIPLSLWTSYVSPDPFSVTQNFFATGMACNGAAPVTGRVPLNGSKLATRPLQINATRDPQTVYSGRETIRREMGAHLVTVHGPGHTQVATGNPEVDRIVVEYLRTGKTTATDAKGFFEANAAAN